MRLKIGDEIVFVLKRTELARRPADPYKEYAVARGRVISFDENTTVLQPLADNHHQWLLGSPVPPLLFVEMWRVYETCAEWHAVEAAQLCCDNPNAWDHAMRFNQRL